ncbi:MAG TPA: tetratricopeptide repeat protein [Candidatus Dormibacteraeota bacterium]|nr:tetratricopeptide repeat protein [Candidatus Dormibacteraeota bacterium]
MAGLGYLFYPWGFVLQAFALVHLIRRRADTYWYFIIFFGGFLGAAAYIVVEVLPDADLLRGVFQGFGRRSRIKVVEMAILDNPSAANYEELGELYWDQKQYTKAREAFNHSIAVRSDSVHAFYRRGLCALELGDFAAAVPDLEHAVRADRKHDSYRTAALLAHAYAKTGQSDTAAAWFAEAAQYSTTSETMYNYACFLRAQNRTEEACRWAQKILDKKRTLPRYLKRIERPWFRKAAALQKELNPG